MIVWSKINLSPIYAQESTSASRTRAKTTLHASMDSISTRVCVRQGTQDSIVESVCPSNSFRSSLLNKYCLTSVQQHQAATSISVAIERCSSEGFFQWPMSLREVDIFAGREK